MPAVDQFVLEWLAGCKQLGRHTAPGSAKATSKRTSKDTNRRQTTAKKHKAAAAKLSKARAAVQKLRAVEAQQRHRCRDALASVGEFTFVYVGNVDGISPEQLEHVFARCGTILRVVLRCSQGLAVLPGQKRTPGDRKYASIEFEQIQGARNALKLNGRQFYGRLLVVTTSPANLPEARDLIKSYKTRKAMRTADTSHIRREKTHAVLDASADNTAAHKVRKEKQPIERPRIQREETHRNFANTAAVVAVSTPKEFTIRVFSDRNYLFGYSFGKCVV